MSSESPEPLVRDAFAVRERLGDPRLPLIIGCLPLPVDPRQWRYPAPFAPRALPRFITTKKQTLRRSSIPTTRQWLMSVSFAVGRQKPVAITTEQSAPRRASVLSASRFEPLVPCMGLCLSRSFGTPAYLYPSSVSLFDPKAVSSSRPALRPCRRAQKLSKVGRRTDLIACSALARPYLDSFEHDGTLAAVGMTIRGELAFGRGSIAPQPCIRWARGPEP